MRAPLCAALLLIACKSGDRPPPPRPQQQDATAPVVDAGPPPVDALFADAAVVVAPDEAARRAGQPTGLTPDGAAAAVATESLVVALATGRASLSRSLDTARGVVELAGIENAGRPRVVARCGADARDTAATYLGRAVDRQLAGAPPLACDNTFVAAAPAAGTPLAPLGRHAVCRSPGVGATPADDADAVVFAPGADGGLRVVAVVAIPPGGVPDRAWAMLAQAVAHARCP